MAIWLAELAAVLAFSAVQLFCQRATAVRPDLRLDEQNAETVARICARIRGERRDTPYLSITFALGLLNAEPGQVLPQGEIPPCVPG